jgi:hypothetical protein
MNLKTLSWGRVSSHPKEIPKQDFLDGVMVGAAGSGDFLDGALVGAGSLTHLKPNN